MLVVVVEYLIGLIESREYLLASRQTERDFTRMRKMSFTNYIWYPLTTAKRSLASGLQAFVKELLMMDRGYPSCELIREIRQRGFLYAMRRCREFCKGMRLDNSNDCIIEHRFARAKEDTRLRVIRFALDNGDEEIIVTNPLFSPLQFLPSEHSQTLIFP